MVIDATARAPSYISSFLPWDSGTDRAGKRDLVRDAKAQELSNMNSSMLWDSGTNRAGEIWY